MSAKKILVLTSTFPRWPGDREPPFVYELSRRLAEQAEIHILAPHAEGAALQETWNGLHITRFRYWLTRYQTLSYAGGILARLKQNRWRYLLVPPFVMAEMIALWRLLRREQFDVIHAHWLIPQGLAAVLVCRLLRQPPPLLCTSHGGDLFALRGGLFKYLKNLVLQRTDLLTTVSQAMRDTALTLGADAKRIAVVPMGVDLHQQFVPLVSSAQGKRLLFVGRLVEKKGLQYLLEALPQILQQQPDASLHIVGDGPEKSALIELADKLGITGQVTFHGAVENTDLPALYQSAAVVVFPSIVAADGDREGFGLVLVEALGCGCAVVATDLPAMQDIIQHEQSALIVPQRRADKLAESINRLLADTELARRLGQTGRDFVLARYDWDIIAERYRDLLNNLANGK